MDNSRSGYICNTNSTTGSSIRTPSTFMSNNSTSPVQFVILSGNLMAKVEESKKVRHQTEPETTTSIKISSPISSRGSFGKTSSLANSESEPIKIAQSENRNNKRMSQSKSQKPFSINDEQSNRLSSKDTKRATSESKHSEMQRSRKSLKINFLNDDNATQVIDNYVSNLPHPELSLSLPARSFTSESYKMSVTTDGSTRSITTNDVEEVVTCLHRRTPALDPDSNTRLVLGDVKSVQRVMPFKNSQVGGLCAENARNTPCMSPPVPRLLSLPSIVTNHREDSRPFKYQTASLRTYFDSATKSVPVSAFRCHSCSLCGFRCMFHQRFK